MNEGFEFFVRGDLFVLKTGSGVPPELFWDRYCDALKQSARAGKIRIFIDARAGQRRPSPSQRQQLEDAVPVGRVTAAVVSDNVLVRMVYKVFSWAGYNVYGFTSAHISDALETLGCDAQERAWIASLTKMEATG